MRTVLNNFYIEQTSLVQFNNQLCRWVLNLCHMGEG